MRALVGLGGNAPGGARAPWQTLIRAVEAADALPGTRVVALSGLWRSAPWGGVRQPDFFNAVMALETALGAHELLRALLALERRLGRLRRARAWGPRTLDLDLLDHGGVVMRPVGMGRLGSGGARHFWQGRGLVLPHPGVAERAFVLLPLIQVAPDWRHPATGVPARALLARLPGGERAQCRPVTRGRAARAWAGVVHNRL